MKTGKKTILSVLASALLLAGLAAGCSSAKTVSSAASTAASAASSSSAVSSSSSSSSAAASAGTAAGAAGTASAVTVSSGSGGLIDASALYTDRDLEQTADTSGAVSYTVTDGQDITITEAGVYIISGTAKECTITVNCADADAKVQLVLDGVSITNTDFPAIYVISADKCFITTTDSENTLQVTGAFSADGTTNTDAVIFSKEDLVLNGTGTLTVVSAKGNGITSKDDLKVTGGTYSITSAEDSLEANDSIAICAGTFTIKTSKDGLHSENDDDNTLGYISISGGTFSITAGDDGIQGTTIVEIDGGTFTISAVEGIEGTTVQINDGTISISASDDGINAAEKSTAYEMLIEINGGSITIVMGSGDTDAVDSNGSIVVNGGTIDITATSAFDYNGTGTLNGGTVTVNGTQVTQLTQSMMGGGRGGK